MAAPVLEWRNDASPFSVITGGQALSGSGFNGAIPVGTSSSVVQVRVYNNFANASGIVDATNCVLAAYDDTIHQGLAQTTPTTGLYLTVKCPGYNGGFDPAADTQFYAIGGLTKHPVPVHSGTLPGAPTSGNGTFIQVIIQIVVPPNASNGAVSQGLWLEYSSTS